MTISMASAVGSLGASQSRDIGIQDFLKILTSQLNNQDPLKPVDNQEFVAQIAQFATLEQSRQLNLKIDSMLSAQSAEQSIGLLGKTVDASAGGKTISGRVSALSFVSGQPTFSIAGVAGGAPVEVSLSQIINIR